MVLTKPVPQCSATTRIQELHKYSTTYDEGREGEGMDTEYREVEGLI